MRPRSSVLLSEMLSIVRIWAELSSLHPAQRRDGILGDHLRVCSRQRRFRRRGEHDLRDFGHPGRAGSSSSATICDDTR